MKKLPLQAVLPAQFDTISDIAHQCPLTGGRAVFIARGLYRTNGDAYFDDDSLCMSTGARHLLRQQAPTLEQVFVQPNPASDQIRVSFRSGTDESAQVQIFDLAGRLVFEATGIPSDGVLDLNLSAVKTGMYICQVSTAGRRYAPVKLSIFH
ncbi:MAG: T9SS type A sorting domain-containing protein [Saprospiraceae bacterium]